MLRRNDWVSAVPDNPEVTAWSDASDASDLEWAAVLEIVPEEVIQGCFPSPSRHHIFLKEMFAALQAVRLAAVLRPGHVLDLRVDNTAAVAAINKGHSSRRLLLLSPSCVPRRCGRLSRPGPRVPCYPRPTGVLVGAGPFRLQPTIAAQYLGCCFSLNADKILSHGENKS